MQGADPLARLANPFLRSRGSLLEGDDMNYQQPGGGGVRGVDPRVSTTALVGLNVELERSLVTRPKARLFSRVALAAFTDLAHGIGESTPLPGDRLRFIGDAGIGIRAEHRIGDTRFVTRFDLPLWMSRPELGIQLPAGAVRTAWRRRALGVRSLAALDRSPVARVRHSSPRAPSLYFARDAP